ncbi:MAG: hypothetical protein IJM25_02845 [Eubacterium sp.]|nr:hypothetical protein [Eubacterium sp.]
MAITTYPVLVSGPHLSEKSVQRRLTRLGLMDDGIDYSGQVTKRNFRKLKRYSEKNGLTLRLTNALGRRRADYRRRFFSGHKPDIGNRYICVYCGKWMKREKVTVDHLYPVGCASRDVRLQKKLERQGIRNINDRRNLVASCKSCNARKANQMGLWILRGKLGRHPGFWFLLYMAGMAAIAGAGAYLYLLFV